ncbi:hypothetical protein [Alteromonas antoniana]|uniref:hypothetical protein n=1 Tax=Alteromonas antoniana TaxID=2803813 RepID=UPI001C444E1D|nr:hypothetical protein [Alteromonas antoniana]
MLTSYRDIAVAAATQQGILTNVQNSSSDVDSIGEGSYGECFFAEGKAVKVTSSISEVVYALRQMQHGYSDSRVGIDAVMLVEEEGPTFAIIQELVDTDHSKVSIAERILSVINITGREDVPDLVSQYEQLTGKRLSAEDIFVIEDLLSSYDSLSLTGCIAMDIHSENVGVKICDGQEHLVLFDQMSSELESCMCEQLSAYTVSELLFEYCNQKELDNLVYLDPKFVFDALYLDEYLHFYEDLKYAFDLDVAYEHLPEGDWGAGGCLAFALVALEEWKAVSSDEGLDTLTSQPKVKAIKNEKSGLIEHAYLQIGPYALDASGLNAEAYLRRHFVSSQAPHLSEEHLSLIELPVLPGQLTCSSSIADEIDNVDTQALYRTLQETGIMPSYRESLVTP